MPVRPADEFDPAEMERLLKVKREAATDEEHAAAAKAAADYKLSFIPASGRGGADDELAEPHNEPVGQPAG
jgi:hypothetical protein